MDGTFDHVMIRVEDLEESLDWYQTHLNYEEKGRWEADTFTNVYLGPEEMTRTGRPWSSPTTTATTPTDR